MDMHRQIDIDNFEFDMYKNVYILLINMIKKYYIIYNIYMRANHS